MKQILDNFGKVIDNTAQFKYYAGRDSKNRPTASSVYITGDQEFVNTNQRQKVWNQANDLLKNFSLIQFAINSHLDYICNYKFTARTQDKEFNKTLEKFVEVKSKKQVCDVYRRLSLSELSRMFYLQKLVFGDSFCLKTKNGKLQLIDPQMITKFADKVPDKVNQYGVVTDEVGAIDQYCLTAVNKDNIREFVRLISQKYIISDGFYPNPTSTRGVSPLITALNDSQDLMDLNEYTLIKAKLQSIFGMAIFRDSNIKGNHDFDYGGIPTNSAVNQPLNFKLQPGLKLSLNTPDRVEFLESKTPNSTYESFNNNLIRKILSSIGIPYFFYNSEASNYASMRADSYRYQYQIQKDRESFYTTLDEMYDFIIMYGILNEELTLPRGITFDDLNWNYIPKTSFVLNAVDETRSAIDKLKVGLASPQQILLELGVTDTFEDIVIQNAEAQRLMKEYGVVVELANPGATTSVDLNNDKQISNSKVDQKE
jgi:capsid protein